MDLIQIVLISIQTAMILSKRHASSSDESIENLLYYRDCQKKKAPTEAPPPPPMPLRAAAPPKPFECPNPKMCCSLSCNNDCGSTSGSSLFGRQVEENPINPPSNPFFPPSQPQQPVPMIGQRGRKRKVKLPVVPPIGARREFGFTKERIKSLIAKDNDIRKILKDLVRVTMQKVDLVDMINSRKAIITANTKKPEISNSYDDDDELE